MRTNSLNQIFESAWTRSQLEQRYLGLSPASVHQFQELLSHMLYPNARLRPASDRLMRNELGQSGLWSLGISGDLPLLSVLIPNEKALFLAREVLLAHTYWKLQGFRADVVILNQEAVSYDQPLQSRLLRILQAHTLHTGLDVPGGVYLRDWNGLTEAQRSVLLASSRVVLSGTRGRLSRQLSAIGDAVVTPAGLVKVPTEGDRRSLPSSFPYLGPDRRTGPGSADRRYGPSSLPFLVLDYFNGIGGFGREEREYCIYLDGELTTPKPWVNVIAGPDFGTLVAESGIGFTWAGNSQANRLTPWRNDPVSDSPGEAIYIRDEDSGEFWSPTAQPARNGDAYRVRHGMGYSAFEHNHNGLEQELTIFVPRSGPQVEPVKISRLQIINRSQAPRRLSVVLFAEWVLGSNREESQMHVRSGVDDESGALTAQNVWNSDYASKTTFLAVSPRSSSFTGDRTRFLGRNSTYRFPQALSQVSLDKRLGAGLDPCGALQTFITLQPGETRTVVGMLGQTSGLAEMRRLVSRFSKVESVNESLKGTKSYWGSLLNKIQVRTPLHSVNLLMNGWLNYQSLSCRFWGRSAYYQSGGAFGFRDQLQDCMGIVYLAPELTREHILRCASRQFPEGDVQHWWHPPSGVGVRTKCSDDMLWLVYVTAHYVSVTGDAAILDERVPFITAPPLEPGKLEHLSEPQVDLYSAPLLEHCMLALQPSEVTGPHGLPLMGNGDWNDGMNLVGREGRGESVWLTWFLIVSLRNFSRILQKVGQNARAAPLERRANQLLSAAEKHCWDGEWYLRAFFDDGSPLGSHHNPEARIDSIAQSWAVMAGVDPSRAATAVKSAVDGLVDEEEGLVHLFWPPFDKSKPHPGYIMGYPPGMRENGGQYTHGSLWLAQACALLGNGNDAVRLLQIMNPIERSRNPESVEKYGGEPYVVAADVSSAAGQLGQSGWTWYTGSASWMYRIWLETVLGFQLRGDTLSMQPCVPDSWDEFSLTYRHYLSVYDVRVVRSKDKSSVKVTLDDKPCGKSIPLSREEGSHRVEIHF